MNDNELRKIRASEIRSTKTAFPFAGERGFEGVKDDDMLMFRMYKGTREDLLERAVVPAAAEVHFAEQHGTTWSISFRVSRSQVSDAVANAFEDPYIGEFTAESI